MFPETTYISLGISPSGDAIVLQPVIPGGLRPFFACSASIAELDSRGRADAAGVIGCLTLSAMKVFYAVINIYEEELIPENRNNPLAVHVPDHSGSKRSLHLRIQADNGDRSVLIRRFDNEVATGHDTPPVMLLPLIALGPQSVADFVGATLLEELTGLHSDVFAPFPALLEKQSG